MKPKSTPTTLGKLLVREGLLTQAQLEEVLRSQRQHNGYVPIGELCVRQKLISSADLQRVLKKYRKTIPLGELLTNMGLITPEQLQAALKEQETSDSKLGRILVERNYLSEHALIEALSLQLGIPKILPNIDLIDKRLLEGLNPEFLYKHKFLPAFREGDTVTVIMANPLDHETLALLSRILKAKVTPAIAPAEEIRNTINTYRQKLEIGQTLETGETAKDLVIGKDDLFQKRRDNIVEVVNFIISNAITERATDIHIEPQDGFVRVRYRIDGILHHKTDLPASLAPKLASRIKALCGLDIAEKRKHQDGRIQARIMNRELDLRVSTYAAIWGENVVIRLQHRRSSLIDLNMLGFSPAHYEKYVQMLEHPSGIILVTGPTGSGKTTTLYASIQHLNKMDRVIITVEDPVEYTIDGVIQANIAPKIGLNYTRCLRAMMRQDPDVLMIGEIRDPEAAEAVVQASLTGHKVLSTFHTDDATGALLRLMDMGIETFLISSTLVSVVAQRLVRRLCDHCKQPYEPERASLAFFKSLVCDEADRYTFYQPAGCIHCNQTGYKGLTGIHEVLVVNYAIRDEILKRSTSSKIRQVARQHAGLVTMGEDGFYKALRGLTSLEEVIRVVYREENSGLKSLSLSELIARCEGAETFDPAF